MSHQHAPVRAAIDIGSNTIHIVVARCLPDNLDIFVDEEELVRIGESVTATGSISAQKRDAALALLHRYKILAEQYTTAPILAVATEAVRKAANSVQFLEDVKRETGIDVYLIDGDAEAILTFYGATYELAREPSSPAVIGVMDLGGGSMELVTARNTHITWHTSIAIGSGWLYDRYFRSDPPSQDDLEVARTFLDSYFSGMKISPRPPALIATGGSANSLLRLARSGFGLSDQETRLTTADVARCGELLSSLSSEEVAQRYQQPVARARILPAGTLIIHALMEHLKLGEIRVSSHGIREGMLLAFARHGEEWLQQVQASLGGTATGNNEHAVSHDIARQRSDGVVNSKEEASPETFADMGRFLLRERLDKMIAWREDVLKHEDIEAVHKMRVASRRLRAVLDAYQPICDPKPFKKAYRYIKEIADILGKARDTDVMIENLQRQLEQVPGEEQAGMRWLITRLSAYRHHHQEGLETFLQAIDEAALKQQVEACLPGGEMRHGKS